MRSIRITLLAGVAALAISGLGTGILTSSAAAAGHCGGFPNDGCAFANANYEGGGYLWRTESGYHVHSFTELAPTSGCTTGSFNDCVSSIDNEGTYTIYYYKNASCTGEIYENIAGTGTNYIGNFWNDSFSSLREAFKGSC